MSWKPEHIENVWPILEDSPAPLLSLTPKQVQIHQLSLQYGITTTGLNILRVGLNIMSKCFKNGVFIRLTGSNK